MEYFGVKRSVDYLGIPVPRLWALVKSGQLAPAQTTWAKTTVFELAALEQLKQQLEQRAKRRSERQRIERIQQSLSPRERATLTIIAAPVRGWLEHHARSSSFALEHRLEVAGLLDSGVGNVYKQLAKLELLHIRRGPYSHNREGYRMRPIDVRLSALGFKVAKRTASDYNRKTATRKPSTPARTTRNDQQ